MSVFVHAQGIKTVPTECYQMKLRWRKVVTLKMSKTDKSGFSKQLKVIFYCISSKNYQFVVEKFENLSKIHEQFF